MDDPVDRILETLEDLFEREDLDGAWQVLQAARRDHPEEATFLEWEAVLLEENPAAANGSGRRTTLQDGPGTTTYEYDKLGREVATTRTIDAVAYTTQTAFDAIETMEAMEPTPPRLADLRQALEKAQAGGDDSGSGG